MSDYRRYFIPGGTFFFTVVTDRRTPLFDNELARQLLADALRTCKEELPFESIAMVLLPDHLHTLWSLPAGDFDFSSRWQRIKYRFTRQWLAKSGVEVSCNEPRRRERRRGVWQRRFWEHAIRDERDLETHFDYIHFNPVKHGYVTSPHMWPWSTFHRYVASGHYPSNWSTPPLTELPGAAGE